MKLTPYLNFNGKCAEAFRFYEKTLGGKIQFIQTVGESPMKDQGPPGLGKDAVIHAHLTVGDQSIMGSDAPPDHFQKPQGLYVSIGLTDVAQAERIWKALAEGAQVQMPFGETFWAQRFGMLVDRFGTPWMVNVDKKMG